MSTTAPAEYPPLPPPLEWYKDVVAVDPDGFIGIKTPGDEPTTYRMAHPERWLQAMEDHWKITGLESRIQWFRDNTQPDPKIAKLRDQLRQLAGDAKTTDQQQAYAHACVLLDLALPKDYTPPAPTP